MDGGQQKKNVGGGMVDEFFHSAPLRISNGIALKLFEINNLKPIEIKFLKTVVKLMLQN